ncbi:MAG: alkaline phosphatase family protein [Asgard group archaeon]|nr:alkaline phosphatase family protein [Asgard group archaeon]
MEDNYLTLSNINGRDDLYYPDLDINISRVLPTALTLFNMKIPKSQTLKSIMNRLPSWKILAESEIKNIVLITLDALGFNQFMEYSKLMKKKFNTNGHTISSVFPTITSTCISSIQLGRMPIHHGIVGQKIYFEEIDNIVDTLTLNAKFGYANLTSAGVNVKKWLWCDYPFKNQESIDHIGLIESYLTNKGLSNFVYEKPHQIGYSSHIDCFAAAQRILETPSLLKTFLDIYIGSIDSITHRYTTDSQALKDEINNVESLLFEMLKRLSPEIQAQTAVFITADHGQENIIPENRIEVTSEEENELATIMRERGRSGRVLHLYSQEGKQQELAEWFREKIAGKGIVLLPKDYPKFMGEGANSTRVIERVGDVIVVMGKNAAIFFGHTGEYDPVFNLGSNATHGSLSEDELLVPLLFGRVDDLIS